MEINTSFCPVSQELIQKAARNAYRRIERERAIEEQQYIAKLMKPYRTLWIFKHERTLKEAKEELHRLAHDWRGYYWRWDQHLRHGDSTITRFNQLMNACKVSTSSIYLSMEDANLVKKYLLG